MINKIGVKGRVPFPQNLSRRGLVKGGLTSGAALLALSAMGRSQAAFAAGESGGVRSTPSGGLR